MKKLRLAWLAVIKLATQLRQLPQSIGKQRQRQAAMDQHEAERLDRICNPSKYRGK